MSVTRATGKEEKKAVYTRELTSEGILYYADGVLLEDTATFTPKGQHEEKLFSKGACLGTLKELGLPTAEDDNKNHKFVLDNMKIMLSDGGRVILSQRPSGEIIFQHLNENLVPVKEGTISEKIFY